MAIMLCFMVLAAGFSLFVDSITVILFLVVATVRLAHFLQFDPVPVIIGEIFTANLGGAATMSGDPPNIILGTSLGLSFWDFLRNNGVICLVGLVVVLVYFYLCFRKKLKNVGGRTPTLPCGTLTPMTPFPTGRFFGGVWGSLWGSSFSLPPTPSPALPCRPLACWRLWQRWSTPSIPAAS